MYILFSLPRDPISIVFGIFAIFFILSFILYRDDRPKCKKCKTRMNQKTIYPYGMWDYIWECPNCSKQSKL